MVAKVELVVGLKKTPRGKHELCLPVAFKPRAWHHVEDAVGAVPGISGVAAALDLDVVDILRVDLGA